MSKAYGTVAGRVHNIWPEKPKTTSTERWFVPWLEWEIDLMDDWIKVGVSVERIALCLMRPVSQITKFNRTRPNRRLRDEQGR